MTRKLAKPTKGSDILIGGNKAEFIRGLAGNDIMTGRGGADTLAGGRGSDVYKYVAASDSAALNGAFDKKAGDTIIGFKPDSIGFRPGADKIDISGLGIALSFNGIEPGKNMVWFAMSEIAGKKGPAKVTDVLIDTNGDGVADMAIRFKGEKTLTANDFIGLSTPQQPAKPVISSGSTATTVENVASTAVIYEAKADGPVTWSLEGDDVALFSMSADGKVTFKTSPDFEKPADTGGNNVYDIIVKATNAAGASETKSVAVSVTDVDETIKAPSLSINDIAGDGTINLAESQAANTTITGTIGTLGAGDTVKNVKVTIGAETFDAIVNANGTWTLAVATTKLTGLAAKEISATITVEDAKGNSATTAPPVNKTYAVDTTAPAITAADVSFAENGVGPVLTATANETVTWTMDGSGADDAKFNIAADGKLTFKTAPDFETPTDVGGNNVYNVKIRATDGAGNVSTKDIAITVTNVDDTAPAITAADVSFAENGVGPVLTATANETVTWTMDGSGADDAKFNIAADGKLTFKTAPDFETPTDVGGNNVYNVKIRATDGAGNVSTKDIAITVTNVDDTAPAITAADVSFAENGVGPVLTATANETVTWTMDGSGADDAKFNIAADGKLTFKNAPDFETPTDVGANNVYNVKIRATDGAGNVSTKDVAITVTNVDDTAPAITAADVSFAENGVGPVLTATANETVTWTMDGSGADDDKFTIGTDGKLTFKNAPDFETPTDVGGNNVYNVKIRATDGAGNVSTKDIAITVTNVDDTAPAITAADVSFAENGVGPVLTATANETVTWTMDGSGADDAKFNIAADGKLTFKNAPDFETPTDVGGNNVYNVKIRATDGAGNVSTKDIAITVTNVDDTAPAITAADVSFAENGVGPVLTATANETVTWTMDGSGADDAKFNIAADGKLTFKNAPDFETPTDVGANNVYNVKIRATDGAGNVSTKDVAITVTNVVAEPAPRIDTTTLTASQGFIIQGDAAGNFAGWSVSAAGDVNSDGFDDLIVGAFGGDDGGNIAGEAYVLFGGAGGFGVTDATGRKVIDLTNLSAAQGFIIQGDAVDDRAGWSVSSAGDVNGDGFDDLMVGAPQGDDGGGNAGEAYVIYGQAFGKAATPILTNGTAAAEKLIGGWDDDTITNIGAGDSARGGRGKDTLSVAGTGFIDIDGGNGKDTLKITGAGDVFDFTASPDANGKILGARIDGFEVFDLSAAGVQTLKLDRLDVLHLSDDTTGGLTTLAVLGGGSDVLTLAKANATDTTWSAGATGISLADYVGLSFNEYLNGNVRVLVEVGDVGVTLNL